MKLYFIHTATPKAKPRNAVFGRGERSLSKTLSRTKSSKTNSGTVIESGPIVAAWMTRTGKKTRNKQKAE